MSMGMKILTVQDITGLEELALDSKGRLKVVPAPEYLQFSQEQISQFCVKHGFYLLPTTELIEWLRVLIGKDLHRTVEIGAGNGAIGRALGIKMSDSYIQQNPTLREYYESCGQPIVPYGADVKRLDAEKTVKKYRPKYVIGAWITQKYKDGDEDGNVFGPDEAKILKGCHRYIMIGHENVHKNKRILETHPYDRYFMPWIISRGFEQQKNCIYVFHGKKKG